MLAKTSDGRWIQLNDSSVIISVLSSFLVDPVKSKIENLVKFYPVETFTDVYGTVNDIANKYFLMFQDKKPKEDKEFFE
jgi:microsomal prostaglandin-E synthase 2